LKTLDELKKEIQKFQTVDNLEQIFNDIFASPEATNEEKRLHEGQHGRLFKTAAEELDPLIVWLKIRMPDASARLVLGNQNYDAEVSQGAENPIRLEIGLAIDGYQDRLLKEAISKDGHGSPNSTYERVGNGKEKTVKATNSRITAPSNSIAKKCADQIDQIAKAKSAKGYDSATILILAQMDDFAIRGESLDILKSCSEKILESYNWPVNKVDIIGKKNGLLASKYNSSKPPKN